MSKLPWVVAPLPGEWLGFWLHRVAAPYGLDLEGLLNHLGLAKRKGPRVTWGRFTDLGVREIRIVATALDEHPVRLRAMQQRISPNGPHVQLGYCRACLQVDRSEARPRHWRRDWMDPYVTHCERHRNPLTPVDACAVRPCRTARDTEALFDDAADATAPDDLSTIDLAFPEIDALRRNLRMESRLKDPRSRRRLRRLVDRIAVHVSLPTDAPARLSSKPVYVPRTLVGTHVPPSGGSFASMRSLRQRAMTFRLAARLLEPHARELRTEVWKGTSDFGRDQLASAFHDAVRSGHALTWSEAEEHVEQMLRRSESHGVRPLAASGAGGKSSTASAFERALAKG